MDILTELKTRLRAAGPRRWPAIAGTTGVSFHTMRKIAYSDIPNPGVLTIQPLLDYFADVDSGARTLPEPAAADPVAAVQE